MEYDENKLYNLALLALFILVVIQLVNMFSARNEHMDPALLNHQYVDWPEPHNRNNIPAPQYQEPKFYIEGDIYPKGEQIKLTNPVPVDEDLACGPHFDWLVPHSTGVNGHYDDMLWAKTSPKMIVREDCLNCKKYGKGKVFDDSESGLPSMNGAGLLEN